jgi:hypothetical protein
MTALARDQRVCHVTLDAVDVDAVDVDHQRPQDLAERKVRRLGIGLVVANYRIIHRSSNVAGGVAHVLPGDGLRSDTEQRDAAEDQRNAGRVRRADLSPSSTAPISRLPTASMPSPMITAVLIDSVITARVTRIEPTRNATATTADGSGRVNPCAAFMKPAPILNESDPPAIQMRVPCAAVASMR